jgi:hypothetical protein
MRLRGAGVWLMMARVTGSTFSIAPQSGQVTSNASSLRPMLNHLYGNHFRTVAGCWLLVDKSKKIKAG